MHRSVACVALVVALLAASCDDDKATSASPPGPAATSSVAPIASTKPAPMTHVEATRAFTRGFVDAFNSHDAVKVGQLHAEDATTWVAGGEEQHGRVAFEKSVQATFDRYKDARLALGRVWIGKAASVAEFLFTGRRVAGPLLGVEVEERAIGVLGAFVVSFDDDGLAKTHREYFDVTTLLGQAAPKALLPGWHVRPVPTVVPAGTEVFESRATSGEAQSIDTVNRVFAALDAKSVDGAVAGLSDDFVGEDYSSPGPAKKGDAKRRLIDFFAMLPDAKTTAKTTQFAAGDDVVTELAVRGTFKGRVGAIKPTNEMITLHVLEIDRVQDGRQARGWMYSNGMEFLTQARAMKPADAGAPAVAAPRSAPGGRP